MSATDMGDHAAAHVWCSDTERRGQDAGHSELVGWATLTRALIAYYQGQAGRSAQLASYGQHATQPGTVIHAKLAAQEMRSRAMLGDADGVTEARTRAAAAIATLPAEAAAAGAFSIPLADDPPYTATSQLLVGEYADAAAATRRVVETVYRGIPGDQPAKYARTLLILALAQAGLGQADAAAAVGTAALDCGRAAWPTMVLAGKLDRSLTANFPESTHAIGYRSHYADVIERMEDLGRQASTTRELPS